MVLQLMKVAGEQVSDEIWYRVVQIITNEEPLQAYATQTAFAALRDEPRPADNLVRMGAYLLGEFGHLVADGAGMGPLQQFRVLHAHWAASSGPTRALLLSTFAKLAHTHPGSLDADVGRVLASCRSTLDQEVQQRSLEYASLAQPGLGELKAAVLEMMPPFPERESAVLRRIKVGARGAGRAGGRAGAGGARPPQSSASGLGCALGLLLRLAGWARGCRPPRACSLPSRLLTPPLLLPLPLRLPLRLLLGVSGAAGRGRRLRPRTRRRGRG